MDANQSSKQFRIDNSDGKLDLDSGVFSLAVHIKILNPDALLDQQTEELSQKTAELQA